MTPTTRAAILAYRAEGLTLREIARAVGLSHTTVRITLRQAGILPTQPVRARNAAQRDRALELYAEGTASMKQIGAAVGAHATQVRRWARAAGLPTRARFVSPLKWRPEWSLRALEMKREGKTWRDIGERFEVHEMTALRQVTRAIREGRVQA